MAVLFIGQYVVGNWPLYYLDNPFTYTFRIIFQPFCPISGCQRGFFHWKASSSSVA